MNTESAPLTYEKALARLEQILEKLSSSSTPLDDSLALYEEGDRLLRYCSKRLDDAEQKIEILLKNREGKVEEVGGVPQTAPFEPNKSSGLR